MHVLLERQKMAQQQEMRGAVAEKRRAATSTRDRLSFAVYASMLGGFVGLVGFLAVACHHLSHLH
jgi:hypothetical protein